MILIDETVIFYCSLTFDHNLFGLERDCRPKTQLQLTTILAILVILRYLWKKKWSFVHKTLFIIENEHETQMSPSVGPKTASISHEAVT